MRARGTSSSPGLAGGTSGLLPQGPGVLPKPCTLPSPGLAALGRSRKKAAPGGAAGLAGPARPEGQLAAQLDTTNSSVSQPPGKWDKRGFGYMGGKYLQGQAEMGVGRLGEEIGGGGRRQMADEAGGPSNLQGSFQLVKLCGFEGCRTEEVNYQDLRNIKGEPPPLRSQGHVPPNEVFAGSHRRRFRTRAGQHGHWRTLMWGRTKSEAQA